MNTKIRTFVTIAILALFISVSCKGNTEQNDETTTEQKQTTEKQGKEYTSKYVCPMHCEGSGSDTEGKCPVCGMDYVLNKEHEENHKH